MFIFSDLEVLFSEIIKNWMVEIRAYKNYYNSYSYNICFVA